ncbi:MAG TPA: hypothetical protein VEC37_02880 [Bacillota bacterium]|nr:hypothetical protein [Bacillota bacterium]
MKRLFISTFILLLISGPFLTVSTYAKRKATAYLIIWENFCVIVRSPDKQLLNSIGHDPLGISLRKQSAVMTINGSYLAIAVPPEKVAAAIKTYHLTKYVLIE